jgi:hypothetical protein
VRVFLDRGERSRNDLSARELERRQTPGPSWRFYGGFSCCRDNGENEPHFRPP